MADHKKNSAWRAYQESAADLFRQMGFEAVVEEVLEGARGKHEVDVVARTSLGGVGVTWIVECKHWKSAVPKAHVLTLAQIAQDTGADRAVLLSEKGFQAGAIAVSSKSNVMLTSLNELQAVAADSIAELSIRRTLMRTKDLERDLRDVLFAYGPRTPPPPELDETITLLGICLEITLAAVAAETAQFPVRLPALAAQPASASDELPIIAEALAAAAEEIASGYAAVRAAVAAVLKSDVEQSQELISLAGHLMDLGATLLELGSDPASQEARLEEIVLAMRAVGDAAEPLRSTSSAALGRAVRTLMRELIDGAYLWFADPNRTADRWADVKRRTDEALAQLGQAGVAVNL